MSHDDFNFEPIRGLPEALPADEFILWQGSPDRWALARDAYKIRWVAAYFVVLAVWRVGVSSIDFPLGVALMHAVPFVLAGLVTCAVLFILATIQARAAVYTLTNKRVAMRIGAALTMTLNLPYTWVGTAKLDVKRSGTGTLAFELIGETRISYLMSWPHVRPWHIARSQPALRCIPEAEKAVSYTHLTLPTTLRLLPIIRPVRSPNHIPSILSLLRS